MNWTQREKWSGVALQAGLVIGIVGLFVTTAVTSTERHQSTAEKPFVTEPQLAAGEWKEEIQIPPCVVTNGRPNVEVNFTHDGDRIVKATIECNEMPVGVH
jgi:hypothetical protein